MYFVHPATKYCKHFQKRFRIEKKVLILSINLKKSFQQVFSLIQMPLLLSLLQFLKLCSVLQRNFTQILHILTFALITSSAKTDSMKYFFPH